MTADQKGALRRAVEQSAHSQIQSLREEAKRTTEAVADLVGPNTAKSAAEPVDPDAETPVKPWKKPRGQQLPASNLGNNAPTPTAGGQQNQQFPGVPGGASGPRSTSDAPLPPHLMGYSASSQPRSGASRRSNFRRRKSMPAMSSPHGAPGSPHAAPGSPHVAPGSPHAAPGSPHAAPGSPHIAPASPHAAAMGAASQHGSQHHSTIKRPLGSVDAPVAPSHLGGQDSGSNSTTKPFARTGSERAHAQSSQSPFATTSSIPRPETGHRGTLGPGGPADSAHGFVGIRARSTGNGLLADAGGAVHSPSALSGQPFSSTIGRGPVTRRCVYVAHNTALLHLNEITSCWRICFDSLCVMV